MRRMMVAFSLVALANCAAASQQSSQEDRIDALFASHGGANSPGYAIAVVRDGEVLLAKGYGSADIDAGRPITPDTSFNIASLSKQFTAAAVAMEIERGRVALEDRATDYLPDAPAFMSEITIAHLVYMTSGLPEYYTLRSPRGGWSSEDEFTVQDAISAVYASGALDYEPGARWTYSNINYQLLAEIVGRTSGLSFPDYLDQNIFGPLGMESSWVDAPIDSTRNTRAVSYVRSEDDQHWREAPRRSPHYGGSGVFASLNDLARWDRALYTDLAFGPTFTERMLSTRRFAHDKDNDAFGLVHGEFRGLRTIWYEGGDYGVSAYMVRLPERDETVICLANFADAGCASKAQSIIEILAFSEPE